MLQFVSRRLGVVALGLGMAAVVAVPLSRRAAVAQPAPPVARVFEMRTYHTPAGKLDALNTRFREHTNALFTKHGIAMIGYWTPADGEAAKNTLVYILAYPSREAADASWKAFRADPEWKKALAESEVNGKLTEKVESVFMNPTDYSPLK